MLSSATTRATAAPDIELGGKRAPRGVRILPEKAQRRLELGDQLGGAAPSLGAAMVAGALRYTSGKSGTSPGSGGLLVAVSQPRLVKRD